MDHDSLPAPVTEHRHLPVRRAVLKRRGTPNYIVRSTAKRLAELKDPKICETLKLPCNQNPWGLLHHYGTVADEQAMLGGGGHRQRRPHIEKDLRNILHARSQIRSREPRGPLSSTRDETTEGQELARSDVPLPCDRFRLVRRPSLEREEAFRVASTAKGKVHVRHALPTTDDAQVAELYSMGLLYDNEENREEVLTLNSIQHEEPVYTIRPSKRGRKGAKKAGVGGKPLNLDLSFTDLGHDNAIAQYIMSSLSGPAMGDEDGQNVTREPAPLRVIYELAGASPSFDVDTSQPPDLVTDTLSDYDYLSDSELDDDTPSQREVLESANNLPTSTWIILG